MQSDEQEIRQLVATWTTATKSGDVDTVLGLMTDDVVFLLHGRPPMRKDEFASVLRSQVEKTGLKIDSSSEIQEIQVTGDWAYMWAKLSVSVSPIDGGEPVKREGNVLTILRRIDGKWLLARDANLLAPVKSMVSM